MDTYTILYMCTHVYTPSLPKLCPPHSLFTSFTSTLMSVVMCRPYILHLPDRIPTLPHHPKTLQWTYCRYPT